MSKHELRTGSGEVIAILPDDPPQAIIDLWDAAWTITDLKGVSQQYGKYDPENAPDPEHTFYGNKLWMTCQEAVQVLADSLGKNVLTQYSKCVFAYTKARTLLPIRFDNGGASVSCDAQCLFSQSKAETLCFATGSTGWIAIGNMYNMFSGCDNLRYIYGVLDIGAVNEFSNAFWCGKLEEVWLRRLKTNIILSLAPKIKYECFRYMIDNAVNTTEITARVAATVYQALCGEAKTYPFNGGTQEEWTQLMADAIARQIVFTT